MSRHLWFVALCWFTTGAWGDQLFIPLDADGNPIETETTVDEADEVAADAETVDGGADEALIVGEDGQIPYVEAQRAATAAYVRCLKEQRDRLFGANFTVCHPQRNALSDYAPVELYAAAVACIEEEVLGYPLDGVSGCEEVRSGPTPQMNLEVRWP